MDPIRRIQDIFKESIETKLKSCDLLAPSIARASELMTSCLLTEHRIFSQMLNRFEVERPGLPAISLSSDTSTLTSIANEYQYADIFSKQIRALGQPGDILLAITTSGESHNIIHAIDAAHEREMNVIALTGREGGQLADLMQDNDIEIRVPSWSSARIHETHTIIINCICDLVDHQLLGIEG